ncbi:hypothetical protein, partial [Proteus mirabilis]|uniref:hypothetical protein n=2 Tax=Proteus mirabilis TaxID=584 RepID=UPI001C63DBEB
PRHPPCTLIRLTSQPESVSFKDYLGGDGCADYISSLGSARNAHIQKYAALAVRCPPRTVNCSLIPL